MPNKPLQYESLKAVLQYMDFNLRLQLAHRLPAVKTAEKMAPLKIEILEFSSFSTKINGTKYQLGICKEYPYNVEIPEKEVKNNRNGGVSYDLDEFGFEIYPEGVAPGDVEIPNLHEFPPILRPPGREEALERALLENTTQLRNYQIVLAQRSQPYCERIGLQSNIEVLKEINKQLRDELLPYHYRRGVLEVPFTLWLGLTITNSDNLKIVHFFAYDMKLQDAMRNLNDFLFGRKKSILVGRFLESDQEPTIVRLPANLKFKVKTLDIFGFGPFTTKYNALSKILDCSSLDLLDFPANELPQEVQHPVIRSAKSLIIHSSNVNLELLKKLPNKEVHLKSGPAFPIQDLLNYIKFLKFYREIGTCISSKYTTYDAQLAQKHVGKELNGTTANNGTTTIPITSSKKLEMHYSRLPKETDGVLTLRIVPA